MSKFDVWVLAFSSDGPPPAQRLKHAFGIDDTSARSLEQKLPRIVKHAVGPKEAGEMRKVLESIGAEVECRPARAHKPDPGAGNAVFRRPPEDILPGRVSAIDPFAPHDEAAVPRISVGDAGESCRPSQIRSDVSGVVRPPTKAPPARSVDAAIRARSLERQRRVFVRRAVGAIVSGLVIIGIDLVMGTSVFLGSADWINVAFDGVGIYFLGVGAWDLRHEVKER